MISWLVSTCLEIRLQWVKDTKVFRPWYSEVSVRRCFTKKVFLKNFTKITGNYLCWSLFLIKLQASGLQLYWKETPAQLFSCKFLRNFCKYLFYGTPAEECFWIFGVKRYIELPAIYLFKVNFCEYNIEKIIWLRTVHQCLFRPYFFLYLVWSYHSFLITTSKILSRFVVAVTKHILSYLIGRHLNK